MKLTDGENNLFCNLVDKPVRKVVHDETAVGVKQDPLTGDVILGKPQPVTQVDQSFSIKAIAQLPPEAEDYELRAVVDPLIKKVKIIGASPTANIQMGSPIPVPDIPLGLTIIPKGMFNRMRYEVWKYALDHLDKSDKIEFPFNDDTVYTVWTSKVLQNWKALISTNLPDGMYYECTYNGDTQEMYLDAYKKFENKTIKIEQSDT